MTVDICDDKCLGCSNGGAGLCRRYRHLVETEKKSMREIIEQLVKEELARANEKFPGFNSNHEAYAVLLEEVEELQTEVDVVISKNITKLWDIVKNPSKYRIPPDYEPSQTLVGIEGLKYNAIRAAEEAIQVAAMCDKWLMLLEKGGDKE